MRDNVTLQIDNREIKHFTNYSIEADIYIADHACRLEFSDPETPITAGTPIVLRVNGQKELTGIVDRRIPSYDKSGLRLAIEARDVLGWVVDAYCESFITLQGVTLQTLAQTLLQNAPVWVNVPGIIYQRNIIGNLKKKRARSASAAGAAAFCATQDIPQAFARIMPGQTVFEVLKTYALSRGLMLYALPRGTLVFGQPLAGGAPAFYLTTRKDNPVGNNIIEGRLDENISSRYSKVTVVGQQQGQDSLSPLQVNTGGPETAATDPTFPFYKPYVATDNGDSGARRSTRRCCFRRCARKATCSTIR